MILLIEDNETIAKNIQEYLQLHEYTVDISHDGEQWLKLAQTKMYDLIILDVMLPWTSWFDILQKIRETKDVPVIMATAKWQLWDKSEWFESWADDYLVKPFELKELLMRVQALLKRSQVSDMFIFKDLKINLEDNEVTKNGEIVDLTNKEWQILSFLLQEEWHALSRSDIVEHVRWWDSLRENDSKLDVYISNLRKKLNKELIETVKGFGYKIRRR